MIEITLKNARKLLKDRIKALPDTIKGKFETENAVWQEIKARGEFTQEDRLVMLAIMQVPFHDSGKIEGLQSYDSSASHCKFCHSMMEAAKTNPSIICGHCYDKKQEEYRTNVKKRHGLQLELISTIPFSVKELSILPIYTVFFRFNSSGEIENVIQCVNYIRIGYAFPMIQFRPWSKNKAIVREAIRQEGKPQNMRFIYSVPFIDGKCDILPEGFDYSFVVASTEEKVQEYLAAGAMECNGKMCKDCGYMCYRVDGWAIGSVIVEKLRA